MTGRKIRPAVTGTKRQSRERLGGSAGESEGAVPAASGGGSEQGESATNCAAGGRQQIATAPYDVIGDRRHAASGDWPGKIRPAYVAFVIRAL